MDDKQGFCLFFDLFTKNTPEGVLELISLKARQKIQQFFLNSVG